MPRPPSSFDLNPLFSQTQPISVKNAINSAAIVGDVSLSVTVDSKDFPTTAKLSPVTVNLTDVYGVGVSGRADGIRVYVHRDVAQSDFVSDSIAFVDQWQSLSYVERLKQLFTLMVQVRQSSTWQGSAPFQLERASVVLSVLTSS